MVIEIDDFNLGQVIGNVLKLMQDKAAFKRLELRSWIDPELPLFLRGDAMRLGQVLLNLVGNAIKFTDQGRILITARLAEQNDDLLRVRFEVSDSGIGMSEEQISRLFNAFEQADASTTRKYGGTGLGLAISKRLINLMGGSLDSDLGVISSLGQGSEFWFEIPFFQSTVEKIDTEPEGKDQRAELGIRRNSRILLVEDNEVNQEVALELLNEAGMCSDVADNGAEALRLLRENSYDLILMDVQMPVMDGLDATRAIRAMPDRCQIPILAMTANAFDEDRQQCIDAGMDDHVAKPVDPDVLFAALLKWLPVKSLATPGVEAEPVEGKAVAVALMSVDPAEVFMAIPGLDVLAGLQRLRGKWSSYERLLRLYAESHLNDMEELRKLFAAGQSEDARRVAHSLKGASGSLGAVGVQALSAELEQAIRNCAGKAEVEDLSLGVERAQNELTAALRQAFDQARQTGIKPEPGYEPVMSEAEANHVIANLERLLSQDDIGASDALRIAKPVLVSVLSADAYARLLRQMNSFDFVGALETLRERQ